MKAENQLLSRLHALKRLEAREVDQGVIDCVKMIINEKMVKGLDRQTLGAALLIAYYHCTPTNLHPYEDWLDLFARSDVQSILKKAKLAPLKKGGQLRLFRGSNPNFPMGLSWTSNFYAALVYAIGNDGLVYQVEVSAEDVIHGREMAGQGAPISMGFEYIVDIRNYTPRQVLRVPSNPGPRPQPLLRYAPRDFQSWLDRAAKEATA